MYTLPDEFFPVFVAGCGRLECNPVDLLSVAANESGCNPAAWNPGGKAAGMWQMTPVAAPGMGWDPHNTLAFAQLSAVEQWPHWERYFAPHKGRLISKAACYVCTYLPAGLCLAGNPDALLCSKDGRTEIPGIWPVSQVESWYMGNLGFDVSPRTGEIRIRQLTAAIDRSTLFLGGVWADYVAKIAKLVPAPDVTDSGADSPVYLVPTIEDPGDET